MDSRDGLTTFFQVSSTIAVVLLQRYLLDISTLEKDMKWMRRQKFYHAFKDAHWYRGLNALHQARGQRLLMKAKRK